MMNSRSASPPMKPKVTLIALAVILLYMYLPGWGPRQGLLTGKVSFQGLELQNGSILLVGPDSRPITAAIKEDGSYKFTNVPLGDVKLAVYSPNLYGQLAAALQKIRGAEIKLDGEEGGELVTLHGDTIPRGAYLHPAYNDHELSGLRTTIRAGSNKYEIELK